MTLSDFVLLGYAVKPHGIKGEVKILPVDTVPERFKDLSEVFIGDDKKTLSINSSKCSGKFAILKFKEINDIETAEKIRGQKVYTTKDNRPGLNSDSYYIDELVGCVITDTLSGKSGIVEDVEFYPGNDVLVCEFNKETVRIPFVNEIVIDIDLNTGLIKIKSIPGLLS